MEKIEAYKKLSNYLNDRANNSKKNYLLWINMIEESKKERFYDMVNLRYEFLATEFSKKKMEEENRKRNESRKKIFRSEPKNIIRQSESDDWKEVENYNWHLYSY